jgi:hypothetical protein
MRRAAIARAPPICWPPSFAALEPAPRLFAGLSAGRVVLLIGVGAALLRADRLRRVVVVMAPVVVMMVMPVVFGDRMGRNRRQQAARRRRGKPETRSFAGHVLRFRSLREPDEARHAAALAGTADLRLSRFRKRKGIQGITSVLRRI